MKKIVLILTTLLLVILIVVITGSELFARAGDPQVSIVTDPHPGEPAAHGLNKLTDVLKQKHVTYEKVNTIGEAHSKMVILAGLSKGTGAAAAFIQKSGRMLPDSAEALTIWKSSLDTKTVWVISGPDDRGLMYGLLDVASRIGWSTGSKTIFSRVKETTEHADVKERAVVMYTMNRAYWESRFYDEVYWSKYLDMMAEDRFNMLEVGFGFENGGFLAPAYPYFFNVDSYPDIRMGDITPAQQKKNLDAFNRLIQMCHKRGIGFRVGFWDHIYRGGYQSNKDMPEQVNSQVQGVTPGNMIAYTQVALAKFIDLVPHLDGILFRAHDESGLKKGEQLSFWRGVFAMLKNKAPKLVVDLHAKEVSDTIVHEGQDRGLTIRMSTKYWMEQMGLPFHPTHTNRLTDNSYRRHSYGDMLNYAEHYSVFYRIWGGTTRILLWGDPEYARRFAASTHIHNGAGFGVNEPLTTKMHAQPHDAKPFELVKSAYRYYDYEFQRYWNFYSVFGRTGYNPNTPSDIWDENFRQHFGARAAPFVQQAMYQASWVLPRIVASCFPLSGFPIASGWAEKQHMGTLAEYAATTPSDVQQFASFDEEAKLLLADGESAKILPSGNSAWFKNISDTINQLVRNATQAAGNNTGREFNSTITDLKILSNLALYHSRRIPAAVSYRLFQNTRNTAALDDAIRYEKDAIEAWEQIAEAAGDMYADTLMMGPKKRTLVGSWKQELADLLSEFSKLQEVRKSYRQPDSARQTAHFKTADIINYSKLFRFTHTPALAAIAGQPLTVRIKVTAAGGLKWVRLLYRPVDQYKEFKTLPMDVMPDKGVYEAVIPGGDINAQWDLMYLVEVMDHNKHGTIYPDLGKQTPYVVVRVTQENKINPKSKINTMKSNFFLQAVIALLVVSQVPVYAQVTQTRVNTENDTAMGKRKDGDPFAKLPSNIERLTYFGERADISPDNKRVAFMSKSFGDAMLIDLKTRQISCLTCGIPAAAFLRVMHLSNGDYLLIGADHFEDIRTSRTRDNELWYLSKKPGSKPVKLGQKMSEGAAISKTTMKISFAELHDQVPEVKAGASRIVVVDLDLSGAEPRLVNRQIVYESPDRSCTVEPGDFYDNDSKLTFTCYEPGNNGSVMSIDLKTKEVVNQTKAPGTYNEVEGIYPDGKFVLVEADRQSAWLGGHGSGNADLWRLRLDGTGKDFVRLTTFNDYKGGKVSNPVVATNGEFIAFQMARSHEPAGVGYGILLFKIKK